MITFTDEICANYDILIFGISSNFDMFYNREEKKHTQAATFGRVFKMQ